MVSVIYLVTHEQIVRVMVLESNEQVIERGNVFVAEADHREESQIQEMRRREREAMEEIVELLE